MNALTVAVTLFLAGFCSGYKWPEKNGKPCGCSRLDFPVCGHDGQTYPNPECADRCGGVGYREGTCDSIGPCGCPFSIQPVCARTLHGATKTFDNECVATCENSATVVSEGACSVGIVQPIYRPGGRHQRGIWTQSHHDQRDNKEKRQNERPCVCTYQYAPVCGLKNGKWTTYSSDCFANCEDVERTKRGKCGTGEPCACNRMLSPVCGQTSDGRVKTYSNQCLADCQEAVTLSTGRCPVSVDNSLPGGKKRKLVKKTSLPCVCTQEYVPVCGLTNGEWTQYPNRCVAKCSNAEPILSRPCNTASQLPVIPGDRIPSQLPVFPDNKHAAQHPVFPDGNYPAQHPVFDGDSYDSDESDEDLTASQLPVFPNLIKKFFQ